MATKKTAGPQSDQEELATTIVDALNKQFKDGQIAYKIGSESTPTDLTDFISTGASLLDIAIANRVSAGIACGRITELTGLEQSGKSLLAAHLMASVQKEGGVSVLLDTENAVNPEFFEAIGLDFSKMVYAQPETVEDVFVMIEKIIETVRKSQNNDKKVIIIVDSVAASPTKKELEADYDKAGYATDKAIILSQAMRKITGLIAKKKIALVFVNQLRQKMNAQPFADQWTTSGGKAIGFHASTRIRLAQTGKIKNKANDVIGVTVKASITKNRLGPPLKSVEFNVYFDRGIDDYDSWLKFCKTHDLVASGGAYFTFTDSTGAAHKMQTKDWKPFLENNPTLREEIYQKIATTMIMSYSSDGLSSDDVSVDSGEE